MEELLQAADNSKMPRSEGRYLSIPSHFTCEVCISQDVFDIPTWQRGKIKMLILPHKWTWRFFPFQHKITPYLLNLSRKLWYLWQEDRWVRRDISRAIGRTMGMLGRALLLLFKSDTHQDNSLSRPCLLCRKPHSKHGLVCRREVA